MNYREIIQQEISLYLTEIKKENSFTFDIQNGGWGSNDPSLRLDLQKTNCSTFYTSPSQSYFASQRPQILVNRKYKYYPFVIIENKTYPLPPETETANTVFEIPTISRLDKDKLIYLDFLTDTGETIKEPVAYIQGTAIHLILLLSSYNPVTNENYIEETNKKILRYIIKQSLGLLEFSKKKTTAMDINAIFEKAGDQMIKAQKRKITALENDLTEKKSAIASYLNSIKILKDTIIRTEEILKKTKLKTRESYTEEIKKHFSNHPLIEDIKIQNNNLYFLTTPLFIYYQGEKFKIGRYQIVVSGFFANYIDLHIFRNLTKIQPLATHNHCFIPQGGTPCFGNLSNEYYSLRERNDLIGIVELSLTLLQSYSRVNPYIRLSEFLHSITHRRNELARELEEKEFNNN